MAKTADLNIPHSAEDRAKSWRCVGCGALSPNRLRSCECPTSVVRGPHGLTDWKIEPYDNASSEQVARWMISKGYATGHGESVDDMLVELEAQAQAKVHASVAWRIVKQWLSDYAAEEAAFSRYADNVVLDGTMTAGLMRALNDALYVQTEADREARLIKVQTNAS